MHAGASHNRFEHSLGVAFKAYEVADRIWNTQREELGMDRADCKIVEVAGTLCMVGPASCTSFTCALHSHYSHNHTIQGHATGVR